jgi:hypothetical protein
MFATYAEHVHEGGPCRHENEIGLAAFLNGKRLSLQRCARARQQARGGAKARRMTVFRPKELRPGHVPGFAFYAASASQWTSLSRRLLAAAE